MGLVGGHLDQCLNQAVRVKGAEENPVTAGLDRLVQLAEFLWQGGLPQVVALRGGGLGAQRPAAEQPHRPVGQQRLVGPDELGGGLSQCP